MTSVIHISRPVVVYMILSDIYTRWEKSPFGTIFPNDLPAPPSVGKPSLHSHNIFPTAACDALRLGAFGLILKRRQSRAVISRNYKILFWKRQNYFKSI